MSRSRSTSASRIFWLGALAAALPLGLQTVLFLRDRRLDAGAELTAVAIAALGGAVVLAVLLGFGLRPVSAGVARALASATAAVSRVAGGDFRARAGIDGPGTELTELGNSLDGALEAGHRKVVDLKLEAERAGSLLDSSRRLIEECICAREPLAKQHPGLAAAYASAAIRQAGKNGREENRTVHGLVEGVEGLGHTSGDRENLRWTPKDARVEVPVPSQILNMSVSGMAVESARGLSVGGSWIFRVGTGNLAYDIPGKIRWCRLERTVRVEDEVRPVYRTGVEFESRLSGKAFEFFGPGSNETSTVSPAS